MISKIVTGVVGMLVTLWVASVVVQMVFYGPDRTGLPADVKTHDQVVSWAEKNDVDHEQIKVLKSGRVSRSDYDRAFERQIECMQSRGIPANGSRINAGDGWSREPTYDPNGKETGPVWRSHTTEHFRCHQHHVAAIEHAYNFSAENRVADWLLERINTCLTKRGIKFPENAKKTQDYIDANIKFDVLESCSLDGVDLDDSVSPQEFFFLRRDFGASTEA